jgi:hypothetical protein
MRVIRAFFPAKDPLLGEQAVGAVFPVVWQWLCHPQDLTCFPLEPISVTNSDQVWSRNHTAQWVNPSWGSLSFTAPSVRVGIETKAKVSVSHLLLFVKESILSWKVSFIVCTSEEHSFWPGWWQAEMDLRHLQRCGLKWTLHLLHLCGQLLSSPRLWSCFWHCH